MTQNLAHFPKMTFATAAAASRSAVCRRAPRVVFAALPQPVEQQRQRGRQFHHAAAAMTIATTRARPRIPGARDRTGSMAPWWAPAGSGRRTIFIQTEATPNADAIKFLPNHAVLPKEGWVGAPFVEYLSRRATISPPYPSPLAAQLMNVDGVTAVFYGSDFITVTKAPDANWAHIRPEVFSLITEAITSGQSIIKVASMAAAGEGGGGDGSMATERGATSADTAGGGAAEADSLAYDETDSEVVGMIKELLETRIRPAIQEDGGDIEFRGFEKGQVLLKLRGACRTCDSSTVTLKNGIESMLMHYIEEVEGVTQVLDQEEEVALAEFARFEEKLAQQKGAVPPATAG